jgi:putative membrane protein
MPRPLAVLAWFGGAILFGWILFRQDWSVLLPAFSTVGIAGVLSITVFHCVPMLMDTLAWRCLLVGAASLPNRLELLKMRWIGESVNSLLPAVQVGGDVLRGRLVHLAGVPGPLAAASIIVDLTLSVLTLIVFISLGLFILFGFRGEWPELNVFGGGIAVGIICIGGFIVAQRTGWLARVLSSLSRVVAGGERGRLADTTAHFNAALSAIYGQRTAILRSGGWALAAWIAGAGEIWLAFRFLGVDAGWTEAFVLESLIQAIRNAAFMIPGALGIQEGGLILLGPLVGLPPTTGLLVSLLKRIRELVLGIPGLVAAWLALHRN